jgi:hypothetical protein
MVGMRILEVALYLLLLLCICCCCKELFNMLRAVFAWLIILVRAQVNGKSLLEATHEEAVELLRAAVDDLQVLVCLGPAVLMDMPSPLQSPLLSSQVSSGASGQVGGLTLSTMMCILHSCIAVFNMLCSYKWHSVDVFCKYENVDGRMLV